MKHEQDIKKTSVRYVKGIGPKRAALLRSLGIETIYDLLHFFPRRYEDRSRFVPLAEVQAGDFITLKGTVHAKGIRPTKNMKIFELVVDEGSGRIRCLYFNQPYLDRTFHIGDTVVISGKVELYKKRLQLNSPEYEILTDDAEYTIHTGRIIPVYPLTEGLAQRSLRASLHQVIDRYVSELTETLPPAIMARHHFVGRQIAIRNIHFPETLELLEQARVRLVFEEFFLFERTIAERVKKRTEYTSPFVATRERSYIEDFVRALTFTLTPSQQQVMVEIEADVREPFPMNRLLQGDVGSGKTVVAAFALYIAVREGFQGAFLVPTEILSTQHFNTITSIFKCLGVSVALLTGSTSAAEKKEIITKVAQGTIDVLLGTHALIQEGVNFKRLGLVVIDEQHKFGVRQRAHLLAQDTKPHLLVMTATPIPRTLGFVLYADLNISTLRELPLGVRNVKTYWITKKKEGDVFAFVTERIRSGDQAYIVFPLIEETEKMDLKAATDEYEKLRLGVFKDFSIGLMHGRMDKDEKNRIMHDFREGTISVLVCTTVIEVGIDNPDAAIIIIEHAERFGLSQLHQMRGRVGRGKRDSFCFLFGDPTTETGKRRLRLMTKTNDGFKIAEEDLFLRGPGDFLGVRQSGLPYFRLADIVRDAEILQVAKQEAFKSVEDTVP